jgi:hypothetical protein
MLTWRVSREGTTGRALTDGVAVPGGPSNMTVDLCTSTCQAAGYVLAGVEFAQECCTIRLLCSYLFLIT